MSIAMGPAAGELRLEYLAEIAVGPTARVDLCRASGPRFEGRLVAVKRLRPELADDPELVSRFLDEVWMTAALRHPNVVEVAGWGTDAHGKYLAVELVEGVSLARLRKTVFETGEEFTERLVVHVAACVCKGLVAAHTLRSPKGEPLHLVHRDLTLENVLVGFNGDVKVADFGLAKAKQRITATTSSLPTRPSVQIAPEEVTGQPVDHRADLFSLGILLFELLAKRPPWVGADEIDTLSRIVRDPPPDLRELRVKIDKELAAIVMGCLEKDPSQRFASAAVILEKLDRWLVARAFALGNAEALARFVRRNAMRQMRWFDQAISGMLPSPGDGRRSTEVPRYDAAPPSEGKAAPRHEEPPVSAQQRPPPLGEPRHPLRGKEESFSEPIELRRARILPRPPAPRVPRIGRVEDDTESTLVQERPGGASSPETTAKSPPRPRPASRELPFQDEPPSSRAPRSEPGPPSSASTPLHDAPPRSQSFVEEGTTVTMVRDELARLASLPMSLLAAIELDATIDLPPPTRPSVPRPAGAPQAMTAEQITSEARRLRIVAGRRADEARDAAAEAEQAAGRAARAAEAAKIAEEAAALAAAGASLLAAGGLVEAARRVERAKALEASISGKGPKSTR